MNTVECFFGLLARYYGDGNFKEILHRVVLFSIQSIPRFFGCLNNNNNNKLQIYIAQFPWRDDQLRITKIHGIK